MGRKTSIQRADRGGITMCTRAEELPVLVKLSKVWMRVSKRDKRAGVCVCVCVCARARCVCVCGSTIRTMKFVVSNKRLWHQRSPSPHAHALGFRREEIDVKLPRLFGRARVLTGL